MHSTIRLSAACLLCAAAALVAQETPATWLGGSTPRGKGGKATFSVDQGELVGTAVARSLITITGTTGPCANRMSGCNCQF